MEGPRSGELRGHRAPKTRSAEKTRFTGVLTVAFPVLPGSINNHAGVPAAADVEPQLGGDRLLVKSIDLYKCKSIFSAAKNEEACMEIDVTNVLGLVRRSVRSFEKDGRPASTVTLTRLYDTSVDDLWDALTSSERLPRWFLPVDGDLRLGGRYQLRGNAGGTITACTPPTHFAATWEFGGGTSWIDVKLAKESGKARLTLEHTAVIEDHWNQFGPGAVGIGWDLAVAGLGWYVTTGKPNDHAVAEAWMRSANGKEFMSQSGEGWRAAHVASGVDPAAAKERSDRTIAFYRGELPPDVAHPGTGS